MRHTEENRWGQSCRGWSFPAPPALTSTAVNYGLAASLSNAVWGSKAWHPDLKNCFVREQGLTAVPLRPGAHCPRTHPALCWAYEAWHGLGCGLPPFQCQRKMSLQAKITRYLKSTTISKERQHSQLQILIAEEILELNDQEFWIGWLTILKNI